MNTIAPTSLPPRIFEFCKKISTESPVILQVESEGFSETAECFNNVAIKIEKDGGTVAHGWLIWDWPGVFTEAEFHAVWRSPEDDMIDITPPYDGELLVVFLPDPSRTYKGRRVDSIRHAANENRMVQDFIRLCEANYVRFGQVRNGAQLEGHDAELYENFAKAKEFILDGIRAGANRNAPCLCGGGERYKRCHEPKLHKLITDLIGK
ncbi:SEC-C metal-binding domain-containing protein [Pseudomonas thivervalensis]|uniref:SEC-C metal-binding domain-containing protein n=1 Tax=Pseudomonas thivervalensis TaxID=86265 RepID=UPI00069FCAC2|nr:SEC-C metal-binding domain-containing protein [Pseudomonas thivervalensis]